MKTHFKLFALPLFATAAEILLTVVVMSTVGEVLDAAGEELN